jgi:hypothetical protein
MFRITFVDETKLPIDVNMSDFIEAKSAKAKGKRFSTLDIAKIEDITPEPEMVEEIDDEGEEEVIEESATTNAPESQSAVDVPFTITNEVPEDSKPVDEQLSLF